MNIDESKKMIELFEMKARLEDEKTITGFLKNLVMNYSRLERELFETIKEKNYMLGVAAHDLRNPLVSIRGFSDLLLDKSLGDLNETQKEFVSLISKTSHELLQLLNELLDFSAISSGSVGLEIDEWDFSVLVEQRFHLISPQALKKDLNLRLRDSMVNPNGFFDKKKITQVMDNFLSNAIKYSFPGGVIDVSPYDEDDKISFKVVDCGPGIPMGEEGRLFGEFKKLNVKPTGGEKSTGLGLAISKKIIEAHKGSVSGGNHSSGGAVFSFTIPREDING